jgi:hypothetical protein
MGLRRVLLLAEVLLIFVEVPGFFVWSGVFGLEVEPIGVLPAISRLAGSRADSVGGRHAAARCGQLLGACFIRDWTETPLVRTLSHHVQLFRPLDLLRQLRRLPDPYAIVASCQLIVGDPPLRF